MSDESRKRRQQMATVVREARVAAGLSQAELAERIGVHKGTIGNLERGEHEPSPETLSAVESALGIDLSPVSLASTSALQVVRAAILDRYAGLSEADRLIFLGSLINYVSDWQPPAARFHADGFGPDRLSLP